jgi:hypothetical protein
VSVLFRLQQMNVEKIDMWYLESNSNLQYFWKGGSKHADGVLETEMVCSSVL